MDEENNNNKKSALEKIRSDLRSEAIQKEEGKFFSQMMTQLK